LDKVARGTSGIMAFAFIHTADWQIGKAFAQFDAGVAAQLRAARLEVIDRMAEVAADAGVGHIVVAGDVFDSELIEDHALRQPLARMAAYPAVMWHLLPGNHDPMRGGGVWERLARLGFPANVQPLLSASAYRIEPNVVLLAAPLAAKQMTSDPTAWMDHATSEDGDLRIGVAHGAVRGFGSLGEAPVPIQATRRQSARLDYLALGDWHGTKEIAPGAWYSGTPESDSFADNGQGNVLLVSLDGPGATPRVAVIDTGHYRWLERRVALARLEDIEPVEREIGALGAEGRRHILRLALEGAIPADDAAGLDRKLAALKAQPLAMRIEDRRLRILASRPDRELLAETSLTAVADRLIARGAGADGEEARAATRALRLLLSFSAGAATPEAGA